MKNASWLDVDRKKVEKALECMEAFRSEEAQNSFLRIAIAAGMKVASWEP